MAGWRNRFDAFAARFVEKPGPHRDPVPRPPCADDYWRGLQELFTRDVTERGLRELIEQDTAETVRFFTREVDLAGLTTLPWYRRYPRGAWRVFLHIAFRLSPARRLLFALSVPLLALAWLGTLLGWASSFTVQIQLWYHSLLLAATALFALLALELRDKLTLKGDLEVARQIQFGLLPFDPVARPGAFVSASMRPANTVGGDYFDVIELDERRLAVTMGDVAGKGMPAALLMALLQGSLRTLITAGLRGPELMAKLNDHLCANIPSNRLVTLFYAEYDTASGDLAYVNAGHNAPLLLRGDGTLARLEATGVALGVVPRAHFDESHVALGAGERLFLYTDGVTEAFDARDTEYGEARLALRLEDSRGLSDRALIDAVREDVLGFCGPVRPRDDMTFMVLTRPSLSAPPAPAADAGPTPPPAPSTAVPLPRWS
ncbi:MAG TPA: PP2C family protein-serine/threonine phosphatase [Vicinamibacteria bacterium]|nr:PP2C family protein-serine/threonine phosphatase [Vicinamibacteria bacterium]